MKPATFAYHCPSSLSEAFGLLAEHREDARVLAGGQSLVPLLAMRLVRVPHLVDLNRIESLSEVSLSDGSLRIGAMVRHRRIECDRDVSTAAPLLARATPFMGPVAVRTRGTIGGSFAFAHPAAEYPAVALALDARIELAGADWSQVSADAFFLGSGLTAMTAGQLITAVRFPVWPAGSSFSIQEIARRSGDFALAGAAVALSSERVRLALFGIADAPVRATAAERALLAGAPESDVAHEALRDLEVRDDIHASSRTRKRIAAHVIKQAVGQARREKRA